MAAADASLAAERADSKPPMAAAFSAASLAPASAAAFAEVYAGSEAQGPHRPPVLESVIADRATGPKSTLAPAAAAEAAAASSAAFLPLARASSAATTSAL